MPLGGHLKPANGGHQESGQRKTDFPSPDHRLNTRCWRSRQGCPPAQHRFGLDLFSSNELDLRHRRREVPEAGFDLAFMINSATALESAFSLAGFLVSPIGNAG